MMDGNSLTAVNLTHELATSWILKGNGTIKSKDLRGISNIVGYKSASKFFFFFGQNKFTIAALGALFSISHGS